MIFLLILSTFTFQTSGTGNDGFLEMPSQQPKALILYFHRYVEKRDAVKLWGESLTPNGFAVAGFTATLGGDTVAMANGALLALRNQPGLEKVPVIALGASMGAIPAARWFATNSQVRALILLVPGSTDICTSLQSSAGRPVLLIQAENDEITHTSGAKIRACMTSGKHSILKGHGHLFPPSAVSNEISQWLDALPRDQNP